MLNAKGKKNLKSSYSVLQEDFVHFMRVAGYTDLERGERGSTEEHLTVTQFKVQAEHCLLYTSEQVLGRWACRTRGNGCGRFSAFPPQDVYKRQRHSIVQKLFPNLLLVIAFMPTGHRTMFAAIVVEILVFAAVRFPFHALITVHSNTAYGTFYDAGQQVRAFIFPFVDVFIPLGLSRQLDLCCLPYILRNNGLMQTIHQQKVFLFYQTVLISGSMHPVSYTHLRIRHTKFNLFCIL